MQQGGSIEQGDSMGGRILNQSKLHKFGVQDWVIQQTIKLFHGVAGSDLVGGNPKASITGDPEHMLIGFMTSRTMVFRAIQGSMESAHHESQVSVFHTLLPFFLDDTRIVFSVSQFPCSTDPC
jgi:hypothetical protein